MITIKIASVALKMLMFFLVFNSRDLVRANVWGGPPEKLIRSIVFRERAGLALLVVSSIMDIGIIFFEGVWK